MSPEIEDVREELALVRSGLITLHAAMSAESFDDGAGSRPLVFHLVDVLESAVARLERALAAEDRHGS